MPAKDKDEAPLSAAEMLGAADMPKIPTGAPDLEAAIAAETSAEAEDGLSADEEAALRAEGIDPRHPVLTIDEQRAAIQRAHKRVSDDARKEAIKALEQQAYDAARGKGGLRTGDPVQDELVDIVLDLAEHSDRIVINGFTYMHGANYTVPRHIANTLREVQSRGWLHQLELDGKGIADRGRAPRNTVFNAKSGAVINGPQAMA